MTAPLAPRVVVSPLRGDEYEVSVTGFAFPPHRHPERSEGSRYLKHMRQSVVNTSQREGAAYSGSWWAPFNSCKTPLIIKPYNRALARRENKPTSLRSLEMHPFWCCRTKCVSPLPADWYLWALRSLTTCTKILHCVQNDGAGRKVPPQAAEDRGVGSFQNLSDLSSGLRPAPS